VKEPIMSDTNDITVPEAGRLPQQQQRQQQQQRSVAPAVDVLEDPRGITLLADMPGVSRERLDVRLDGDTLAVEGSVDLETPDGMRPLWAEVNVPRYRRTFRLSRELDPGGIEATLKDGVLTLRIPRQPHAQPRRIAVVAG
jgi:HSP20 family molecular chaperone IbpA